MRLSRAFGALGLVSAAAACCAAVVSCNAFGTSDDAAAPDAAVNSAPDGASTADAAASDGGVTNIAEPRHPCSSLHLFCADFEDGGTPPLVFDESGGSKAVANGELLSSFAGRTDTSTAGLAAAGSASWPLAARHAHLELDMFLEHANWSDKDLGIGVLVLLLRSSTSSTGTVLFWGRDASGLSVETSPQQYFDTQPFPTDRWFHVVLEIRTEGTLEYQIDGQAGAQLFPAQSAGAEPQVSLTLGFVSFAGPTISGHARYDNVVLDVE